MRGEKKGSTSRRPSSTCFIYSWIDSCYNPGAPYESIVCVCVCVCGGVTIDCQQSEGCFWFMPEGYILVYNTCTVGKDLYYTEADVIYCSPVVLNPGPQVPPVLHVSLLQHT